MLLALEVGLILHSVLLVAYHGAPLRASSLYVHIFLNVDDFIAVPCSHYIKQIFESYPCRRTHSDFGENGEEAQK